MRILHVINSLHIGGAETSLLRLCISDKKNVHSIITLKSGGEYLLMFKQLDIQVYTLNIDKCWGIFILPVRFYKILKEVDPVVVQTWLYHSDLLGGVFCRIFGQKNVFWNIRNANFSKDALKFSTRLIVKINSILSYIVPRKIVSVSDSSTKGHIGYGFDGSKFVLIRNGFEHLPEKKMSCDNDVLAKVSSLQLEGYFILGMVARYDRQKDHNNLFESLVLLKSRGFLFKCILVGKNMSTDNVELVKKIQNLKLEDDVLLLGQLSDVSSVFSVLNLHVLSSLGEAFPNVLVESMLSSTLNVSTDVGDAKVIVDKYGWIVTPGNPLKLAENILSAYDLYKNDRKSWNLMRTEGYNHVLSSFSIDRMVMSYNKLWSDYV